MNDPNVILLADDDDDECLLMEDAFRSTGLPTVLIRVKDGLELMDYLLSRGEYRTPGASPRPRLILLDLNMPKKNGRQALAEIKEHPSLRSIPVVILSVSQLPQDIAFSYDHGASSYICKPVSFDQLRDVLGMIERYWFHTVELPRGDLETTLDG